MRPDSSRFATSSWQHATRSFQILAVTVIPPTFPEARSLQRLLGRPGPSARSPGREAPSLSSRATTLTGPRSVLQGSSSCPKGKGPWQCLCDQTCVPSVSTLAFPATQHLPNQFFTVNPLYENSWMVSVSPTDSPPWEIPGSTVESAWESTGWESKYQVPDPMLGLQEGPRRSRSSPNRAEKWQGGRSWRGGLSLTTRESLAGPSASLKPRSFLYKYGEDRGLCEPSPAPAVGNH